MLALIATDGSEDSLEAAERASLVLRADADLLLLNVQATPIWPEDTAGGFEGPTITEEESQELVQAEAAAAEDILERTAKVFQPREVERLVVYGDAGASICEAAESRGADVIVVGSHGKNLLERLLVGSVARHVVDHAPCPVLVYRRGE